MTRPLEIHNTQTVPVPISVYMHYTSVLSERDHECQTGLNPFLAEEYLYPFPTVERLGRS